MVDECFFWIHFLTSSCACLASIHGFALPVHLQYFRLVNDPYIGHENEIIQLKIRCPKNGPTVLSLGGPSRQTLWHRQVGETFGRPNSEAVDGVLCCGLPERPGDLGSLAGGRLQLLREENLPKNTGKTQY